MIGPYWTGDTPIETVDVTLTRDGYAIDLSIYERAGVVLTDPNGTVVDSSSVGVQIADDDTHVAIDWPESVSLFTVPGTYTLQVILYAPGATSGERAALLPFDVRSVALAVGIQWCTPRDVLTITRKVVDDDDIERAAAIIDVHTGAGDLKPSQLRPRNRRMLRLATAYQSAWMKEQYDLFDRHDVTSMTTEGGSFTARDALTMTLAPLAKAALKRATWSGDRTTRVNGRVGSRVIDPVISDAHPWVRL